MTTFSLQTINTGENAARIVEDHLLEKFSVTNTIARGGIVNFSRYKNLFAHNVAKWMKAHNWSGSFTVIWHPPLTYLFHVHLLRMSALKLYL